MVVRDREGQPVASLIQKILYPHSVESIEALAAKHAVKFAVEIGIREGEFEGDSKTVVSCFNAQ